MRTILIAAILAMGASAQPTEPAPLIQLTRRPGLDASSIRRYVDAKAAVNVVGIASITGSIWEQFWIWPRNCGNPMQTGL